MKTTRRQFVGVLAAGLNSDNSGKENRMAIITTTVGGRVLSVSVDGIDITDHILATPPPQIVKTSDDEHGIYAIDLRLAIEAPGRPFRRLCEESVDE